MTSPERSPRDRDREEPAARKRSLSPPRRSPPRRSSKSRSPPRREARRSRSPDRRGGRERARSPEQPRDRDRRRSRSRDRERRRSRSRSPDRGRGRSRSPGVRYGLPPAGRTPPRVGTQLFVAGIHFHINERDLEDRFNRYGRVKEARVVRHPQSGESRGFAFVVMSAESEAEEAVQAMNGRDWNGRRLLVEIARNPR